MKAKEIKERTGLTQARLAELFGVRRQHFHVWYTGKANGGYTTPRLSPKWGLDAILQAHELNRSIQDVLDNAIYSYYQSGYISNE